MRAVRDIERKIKQKEEEIQKLREKLNRAEAYLEAMQESLRLLQRATKPDSLRPNSMVDKARKILRREGRPMHVSAILRAMGKEVTKDTKSSLSSSLGSYVREDEVFTRPLPNTFGLKEFEDTENEEGLPDGFGQ